MPANPTEPQVLAVFKSQQRYMTFNYTRHRAIKFPRSSADSRALTLEHETLIANTGVVLDLGLGAPQARLVRDVRRTGLDAHATSQAFQAIGALNCV
jgi:hypothetical protein